MTPDARDAPLLRLGVRHVLVLGVAGALGVAYASAYGVAVGAGAIAAVSVMLWTAVRPRTALLVIIGSAAPLSGLRRGFPVPFLRLGEALILGGALVTLLLVDRYHGAKWRSVEYFLTGYVVLTIVVGYWSMRRTGVAVTAENVGLLIVPAFHALAYFTAKGFGRHPDAVRQGLRLTLLGSIPITALGILQYVRAPFVGSFLKTFGDPTIFDQNVTAGYVARATGTFNHWHLLAGYLFVVVVLAVSLLLEDGQNVMTRRALVAVVAINAVGLLLTLTYTAFIGVIGATILIGFSTGRGLKVLGHMALAAVVLAVVFWGALAGRAADQFSVGTTLGSSALVPQTVQYRLQVWQDQFLPSIESQPVLGYGPQLPASLRWKYTESLYVTLLLRGGLVLLLAFAALWLSLIRRAFGQARVRGPNDRALGRTVGTCALLLIPMQALFPYFTSPGLPHLLMILAGLSFAGPVTPRHRSQPRVVSRPDHTGPVHTGPVHTGPVHTGPDGTSSSTRSSQAYARS